MSMQLHQRTRYVVIASQPLLQAGVKATLTGAYVECVGSGSTVADARRLYDQTTPDLIILDWQLPGSQDFTRAVATATRDTRVLALSSSDRHPDVVSALESGASGYVLKTVSGTDLAQTIHIIATGETYITPQLAARLLVANTRTPAPAAAAAADQLTRREQDILCELSKGKSNKEIGRTLRIAEKTVKHYITSILQKLSAKNRTEAVVISRAMTDRRNYELLAN
jgi:DNA-binding NarL/FixJ family response regulator